MKNLFRNIMALTRAIFFVVMILCYFAITVPIYLLFYKRHTVKTRRVLSQIVSFFCEQGIKAFGFHISEYFQGDRLQLVNRNFLYVSNHLTYMDILVMCCRQPLCFVTSQEIKETPFLGHICQLAGCVFVERRNKSNLGEEVKEITDSLKEGLSVVVFPEATSTNGEEVRRFKRPLFKAAIDSGVEILPLTVNYLSLDGKPVTKANRDNICWYDDMTFPDHFFNLLKTKKTKVSLTYSKPLNPSPYGDDLNGLVGEAHRIVSQEYRPITH